jgi:hypothetical protein
MTFQRAVFWTSHTARRVFFTILLPLTAIGFALSERGRTFPIAVPCLFAVLVGLGSNLAIAESYGLIMENFDTSDLQPGMTGRPVRHSVSDKFREVRTNFSCYPRISAGIAVTHSLKFIFGAVATAICGRVERRYGGMRSAGIVAGVLMLLTILLTVVLVPYKSVQMIPARHDRSRGRTKSGWEPLIIGNPSGTTRKLSILGLGRLTRWSEIRRRNRLEDGLTGG